MGYKVAFMDNEVYSAQDINEHFGKLFSGGVALVESGNILADLNNMTEDIVDYGVLYDACLVVKTKDGYKISAGTAFMHDGSSITFDKNGYDFTAEEGKYWYVYLERNEPENRIDIIVSETKPSENIVLLAHIDTIGNVYDRREYAQLKINSGQTSTLRNFNITYYKNENYQKDAIDVGRGDFSYILIFDSVSYRDGATQPTKTMGQNMFMLTDGQKQTVTMYYSGNPRCTFSVTKNGQYLETTLVDSSYVFDHQINFGLI